MIVGGHGRSCAGNRGGDGSVRLLQPRDRPAGDGRQGGARRRASALGPGLGTRQARALDARHGPVDPRLAAAGARAAARTAGGGAARAGDGPDRAAVSRPANARRARRASRAHRHLRDHHRRDRRGSVRAATQHRPHLRAADDRSRAAGSRTGQPAALHAARDPPLAGGGHDARRGSRVRLERYRDQARLRRSRLRTPRDRCRMGAGDGGGLRRGRAQRVELVAGTTSDSGGPGRVRDSDDRAGGGCAAAVRRELRRHPARRRPARALAGAAGRRRGRARALARVARPDGR
jgi:hypothetical protein